MRDYLDKKYILSFVILMLLVLSPLKADAFWWLFGRSVDEVQITYLYINGLSYDESGESITLFNDYLEDGLINIRGRAVINKGEIGSVMVSVDGKETWQSAELSRDGAFQYYFRPEPGRTYDIYIEAMETAGRTNDVDQTHKVVAVSELSYEEVINSRLAEVFAAYMERDAYRFMDYISWDFVGGDLVLEQAVNKDFSNFADIDIQYSILNLAQNSEGMIAVVLGFDRRVTASRDGKTLTDSGITEFVFKLEDNGPQLYSMSHPIIFGISDASSIGTGIVNSAENDQVIAFDDQGGIDLKPVEEIVGGSDDSSGDDVSEADYRYGERLLSHLQTGYVPNYSENYQGYRFSDDTVLDLDWDSGTFDGPIDLVVAYDTGEGTGWYLDGYLLAVEPEVGYIKLQENDINNVKEVPVSGYTYESDPFSSNLLLEPDRCYALKLRNGSYAVISFKKFEALEANEETGRFWERTTLYFKYRDDGGRQF